MLHLDQNQYQYQLTAKSNGEPKRTSLKVYMVTCIVFCFMLNTIKQIYSLQ